MARDYVKQPNGKYAAWSTIVDDFVMEDMTTEELTAALIEEKVKEMSEKVKRYIIEADERPEMYQMYVDEREAHRKAMEELRDDE